MQIEDILNGIIGGILAFLAKWGWDYYVSRRQRLGEWSLEWKLIPEVHYYGEVKLVDVIVQMKNVGTGLARIKCPSSNAKENPLLEVRKVPLEKRDSIILFDSLEPLFPPIEFLKDQYSALPYVIEPNTTASEHIFFTTIYDGVLQLRVKVWLLPRGNAWDVSIVDFTKAAS